MGGNSNLIFDRVCVQMCVFVQSVCAHMLFFFLFNRDGL